MHYTLCCLLATRTERRKAQGNEEIEGFYVMNDAYVASSHLNGITLVINVFSV
jgi:hypothetical protein